VALAHLGADGQATQPSELEAPDSVQVSSAQLLAGESGLVALAADGAGLCSASRSADKLTCQAFDDILPPGTSTQGARLVLGSCDSHAVLQLPGGAAVLAVAGGDGATVAKFAAGATAAGCFMGPGPSPAPLVSLATPGSQGLQLAVVSAASSDDVRHEATIASLAAKRVGGHLVGVVAHFVAPSRTTYR
jgi:hypothetical protein